MSAATYWNINDAKPPLILSAFHLFASLPQQAESLSDKHTMGVIQTPLKLGSKEFRLLKIRPPICSKSNGSLLSLDSAPIECDLFTASRNEPPVYLALSYTWGDPNQLMPIHVNGCMVSVTLNLATALEHIREEREDVIIWVDAICIDQSNDEEKSDQVQAMAEIYSAARSTIVWLGLAGDGSDEIIEKCNKIGDRLSNPKSADGLDLPTFTELVHDLTSVPPQTAAQVEQISVLSEEINNRMVVLVEEAEQDIPAFIAELEALGKLMSRDYWGRVWTHQEFIVSRDIIIQCGSSKIEFAKLTDARLCFNQLQLNMGKRIPKKLQDFWTKATPAVRDKLNRWELDGRPDIDNDPDLATWTAFLNASDELRKIRTPAVSSFGMRRAYQKSQITGMSKAFDLISILSSVFINGNVNATLPRDRIYGMLGMASDKQQLGLVPNYDRTVSDTSIYTAAAHAMITAGHVNLLCLSQQQPRSEDEQRENTLLPSWVPDWSRPIVAQKGHSTFRASGDVPFNMPFDSENCLPGQIGLFGWTIDTIETILPAWINPDDQTDKDNLYARIHLNNIKILCLASTSKMAITGHEIYARKVDRNTAHFRVPVADQEIEGHSGQTRRATEISREGYNGLDESLPEILNTQGLEAMNNMSVKCQNYLAAMRYQKSRRPFLSKSGYVGLAPEFTKEGDVLTVLCGSRFPYVLRRNEDQTCKLVGDSYVHGIMDGEFVKNAKEMEKFILS